MKPSKPSTTAVCALHYAKLLIRLAIFITLLVLYVLHHVRGGDNLETVIESRPLLLVAIWAVFVVEMVLRFFPSRFESPGSQKQFARNYVTTGRTDIRIEDNNAVFLVALVWISFNLVFGALHQVGILDDGFRSIGHFAG